MAIDNVSEICHFLETNAGIFFIFVGCGPESG